MVTSYSLAGQLMLSLVTWMCQLVLRGRRATAPSTPWDTGPCGCSFGWSGKLGELLRGDSSAVFLESPVQVHFIDWFLTWWCGWK